MTPEVATLFRVLADLSPESRAQYFASNPVEPRIRREVEELLAHDSTAGDRISHIVGSASMTLFHGSAVGSRCGPFRLVSEIGRGGMGVVYLAERVDGEVAQRAAVKLMQPGWNEIQRERFLQERAILAALSHPNIAHLLDAGHLHDGQPYLAMEYVEGKPIHEYCDGFSVRRKIGIFLKVCRAVAYLHANSVLHRDLKPGNILVPQLGEPKLLDFGIAKILDLRADETATHLRMLTPDYASPEQMSGGLIGTASDIYSLGAVLYRLLTGRPPRDTQSEQLPPELKGDLGRVLQTAMRREPEDRYSTVEDFAADLQACLDSRPIRARPSGLHYRTAKFIRRHPLSVALAGALLAALIGVGWLALNQLRSTPAISELRPRRLTANTPELPIQAAAISPRGESIAFSDPLGIHLLNLASGETRLLPQTAGHVFVQWTPDGAGLESEVYNHAGEAQAMQVPLSGGPAVKAPTPEYSSYSPDRKLRVTLPAGSKQLMLQDANGGNSRLLWSAAAGGVLGGFSWSPDSTSIGVLSYNQGSSSLETIAIAGDGRKILVPVDKKLAIISLVWPDRNRMIVAIQERASGVNSEGGSNLWELPLDEQGNLASGGLRRLTSWTDFPIRPGSLTTDGRKLVFVRSFRQRDVYVAPLEERRTRIGTPRRLTLDLGDDYPTAWTGDSRTVIFTSDRNGPSAIFLQDLDKQTANQLVFGPTSQIIPRLAPDGKWILFYGRDQGKRGLLRAPVKGGKAELWLETSHAINFRCSPAGPCILSEVHDGSIVVFELDLTKGKRREIYRLKTSRIATPDISPDGRWLATADGSKIVVRSFQTGAVAREVSVRGIAPVSNLVSLDYAPDGKGFFAGDTSPTEARQLYIDLSGKASVLWRQAGNSAIWAIPSPDGKHLALMFWTDDSNLYMVDGF